MSASVIHKLKCVYIKQQDMRFSYFLQNAFFNSFGSNEVWLKDGHYLSCIIHQACLYPHALLMGFNSQLSPSQPPPSKERAHWQKTCRMRYSFQWMSNIMSLIIWHRMWHSHSLALSVPLCNNNLLKDVCLRLIALSLFVSLVCVCLCVRGFFLTGALSWEEKGE